MHVISLIYLMCTHLVAWNFVYSAAIYANYDIRLEETIQSLESATIRSNFD